MDWDPAAAPSTIPENPEATVTTLIKIPVAGPRTAAATKIIKTLAQVAMVPIPVELANNSTILGAILPVIRARKTSRWVIAMMMTMNHYHHAKEPTWEVVRRLSLITG